jgi:DNA invertase Pin-like site-specific DNA recombinase
MGDEMAIIGYARVSTNGQDLTLQVQALRETGCTKIWEEKKSGARADRPKLARLLRELASGDTLLVTRLDRLARSTRDLLNIIHQIDEAGAEFRSLADAWCDTTTPHGKLILTVLGGLAEFERSLILARTKAGIEHARDIGKTFGRPRKLTERQRLMIAERRAKGETMEQIAEAFGVGVATIYRAAAKAGA